MRAPRFLRPHKGWHEQLDAYADGELDVAAARGFAAHIAGCGDCSEKLERTRALKSMLATMPVVSPPRSFHLTPAMVAAPAPAAPPLPATGAFRVAQFATGFAVLVLAAVAVVDLGGSSNDSSGTTTASAEREAALDQSAPVSNAAGAAPAATHEGVPPAAASPASVQPTSGGVSASGFATPTVARTAASAFAATTAATGDAISGGAAKSAGGEVGPGPLALRVPNSEDDRDLRPVEVALAAVVAAGGVTTLALYLRRRRA